jgi:cell division protein FtsZ
MSEGGAALMAVGRATGDERARKAAESAISSALLDVTIDGARGILFNITGGPDLSLFEVNEAAAIIKESAHPDVNLIFGAQIEEGMGDEVRVTVIATGFEHTSRIQRKMDQQPVYRQQPQQPAQQPQRQQPPQPQPQPQQRPMQQYSAPPAPANNPPPQERPEPPPKPQQPDNFAARVYDEDNIEIPTFLRKRR